MFLTFLRWIFILISFANIWFHLILLSNSILILLIIFFVLNLFFHLFYFSISSLVKLFHLIFILDLTLLFLLLLFLIFFLIDLFLKKFHPLMFWWLKILLCNFFFFVFYKIILFSWPKSQVLKISPIWLRFFLSIFLFEFFSISSFDIGLLSLELHDFFRFDFYGVILTLSPESQVSQVDLSFFDTFSSVLSFII